LTKTRHYEPSQVADLTAQVVSLQEQVIKYQAKYEALRKSQRDENPNNPNAGGGVNYSNDKQYKLRNMGQNKKLQEDLDNLKFQVFYADNRESIEASEMRKLLSDMHRQNVQLNEANTQLRVLQTGSIQDWLLHHGDLAEQALLF